MFLCKPKSKTSVDFASLQLTQSKSRYEKTNTCPCVGRFLCDTTEDWTVPLRSFNIISKFDLAVQNVVWLSKRSQQLFTETGVAQQRAGQWRQCGCSMSGSCVHTAGDRRCTVQSERPSAQWRLHVRRTRGGHAARNGHRTCETVGSYIYHTLCCSNKRLIIRVCPQIVTWCIHWRHTRCWRRVDWNSFCTTNTLQVSVAEWLARLTAVWEDPRLNHTADSCVYRDSCCDIQSWARAVHLYCSA